MRLRVAECFRLRQSSVSATRKTPSKLYRGVTMRLDLLQTQFASGLESLFANGTRFLFMLPDIVTR